MSKIEIYLGFKMSFKNFKYYSCKTQTMKSSNLLFAKPKLCHHLILEYTWSFTFNRLQKNVSSEKAILKLAV